MTKKAVLELLEQGVTFYCYDKELERGTDIIVMYVAGVKEVLLDVDIDPNIYKHGQQLKVFNDNIYAIANDVLLDLLYVKSLF